MAAIMRSVVAHEQQRESIPLDLTQHESIPLDLSHCRNNSIIAR